MTLVIIGPVTNDLIIIGNDLIKVLECSYQVFKKLFDYRCENLKFSPD